MSSGDMQTRVVEVPEEKIYKGLGIKRLFKFTGIIDNGPVNILKATIEAQEIVKGMIKEEVAFDNLYKITITSDKDVFFVKLKSLSTDAVYYIMLEVETVSTLAKTLH